MAHVHAGHFYHEKEPDGEPAPPPAASLISGPTRWGFPPNADPGGQHPRLNPGPRVAPPEPDNRPSDGEGEFDPYYEAENQPLPGALPTLRFWVVILSAMAVVVMTAVLMMV